MKSVMLSSGRMKRHVLPIIFIGLLMVFSTFVPQWAVAQRPTLDCEGTEKMYRQQGIPCYCKNGKISCDKPSGKSTGSSKKSTSGGLSTKNQMKLQLFQGILDGVTQGGGNNAATQQQKEAQQEAERQQQFQRAQKQRELEFERQKNFAVKKDQLLGNLKGSSTGALVDFKNLDGDAETMRKAAGDAFDQSSIDASKIEVTSGTNFFGTTLSEPEITTLMEPENDPIIVDLNKANTFVVQSLKQNNEAIKKIETPKKEEGTHKAIRPECKEMIAKYNKQVDDMKKFQNQIEFTNSQLDEWRQQSNAAFWNAVVDGASLVVGEYFDYIKVTV